MPLLLMSSSSTTQANRILETETRVSTREVDFGEGVDQNKSEFAALQEDRRRQCHRIIETRFCELLCHYHSLVFAIAFVWVVEPPTLPYPDANPDRHL